MAKQKVSGGGVPSQRASVPAPPPDVQAQEEVGQRLGQARPPQEGQGTCVCVCMCVCVCE